MVTCPRCGAEQSTAAHFCTRCGQKISSDSTNAANTQAAKPPESQSQTNTVPWIITPAGKATSLIIAGVIILGSIGAAVVYYFLSQPKPTLSVTSKYHIGSTPAGASSTTLHVTGQYFAANAPITFLLDNRPLQTAGVRSDENGNIATNLTISESWKPGKHTLTARDTANSTDEGVTIQIVPPGEANTPGPYGSPSNTSAFQLQIQQQYTEDGGTTRAFQLTFHFSGQPQQPNVANGHPCGTGKSYIVTLSGSTKNTGADYQEQRTLSCELTYKSGELTYKEMVIKSTLKYTTENGTNGTCTIASPRPFVTLEGAFTGPGAVSGTIQVKRLDFTCDPAITSWFIIGGQGKWNTTFSQ
uniref:Zinc-ribbon domain-containing protein n=1 Tax=Thermosporothrix sp. COM3 TaxID=2490863 RepID=A0A455SLB6_9CHLR|nr:hypothetical protein KTC_06250 [Thermosporothrix sp. COM3]